VCEEVGIVSMVSHETSSAQVCAVLKQPDRLLYAQMHAKTRVTFMENLLTGSAQTYICSRPFEWCEIHPDGSVFFCCPAWLKRSIGNLLQQPIAEIWNGPVAQEIRKSILNGSFHNCSSKGCPHLNEKSRPVQKREALVTGKVQRAINTRAAQLGFLPTQLNLCFDQSCNLACPSCRGEFMQASGAALEQTERIAAIIHNELLPEAETVTLSGFGDPFGSPTYRKLLQGLNRNDFPRLRAVRLHSNGQLLTAQMWTLLPELQPLISELEISIDAANAATYGLNRPGGDFEKLLENLDFLSQQECRLSLSMVVQQNNLREIPQLVRLAEGYNARVYLSRLVNWGTFTRKEFQQRAVALPQHPEHAECRQLLRRFFDLPRVDLGILTALVKERSAAAENQCPRRGASGIKR
jgi:MoaA/NifB/PqqE/SkfB family radical SAM enzyme